MNNPLEKINDQASRKFSALFSFAMLLVLVLAQNADWGNHSLLWWGSIGLFLLVFFVSFGGVLTLEKSYTIWIISFMGFCALSALWAVNVSNVVSATKSMVVHTVVLLCLRSAIYDPKGIEQILKIIMLSVLINIVWILLTNQSMFEQTGGQDEVIDRLGTEGSWNANEVGMMAATAMVIALYFREKANHFVLRWVYIGIVLLMIFASLLSGSRKALVMVLMGLCGFLYITAKGKRLRVTVLLIGVVLGLYYLIMEVPFFYSIIGWRMEGFVASLTGIGEVDSSTDVRDAFLEDAIRAWKERPILGCGIDCYRNVNRIEDGMYAHNNYAELLADLGIVGMAIYYSAYIHCVVKLLKVKAKDHLTWLLLIILLIQLIMDYGCVSYNSLLTKLVLMLAFSLPSTRGTTQNKGESQNA